MSPSSSLDRCCLTSWTGPFSDTIRKMLAKETKAKQHRDTPRTALALRVAFPLPFYRTKGAEARFPLQHCQQTHAVVQAVVHVCLDVQLMVKSTGEDLIWPTDIQDAITKHNSVRPTIA